MLGPMAIERGPLPEESLDALITVLDEIRLGRSRSRSELVVRTGLSRAIVAQRVGELIDRRHLECVKLRSHRGFTRSNGSRHSRQRHSDLHAVEPKRDSSSVSGDRGLK